MQKKLFLFLLVFFFTYSLDAKNKQKSNRRVNKITVYSVKTTSLTEIQIDCDRFYKEFGKSIKRFELKNNKDINRVMRLVKEPPIDSLSGYEIDTRAKLLVRYSDGLTDSLCIDGLGNYSINDKIMRFHSYDLIIFIDSLYQSSFR